MTQAEIYTIGQPLPLNKSEDFINHGTAASINMPTKTICMVLDEFEPKDLIAFEGMANFSIALCKNFMLITINFKGYCFDVIWSPVMAKASGEPLLSRQSTDGHLLFNFILADRKHVIRGIRSATIAPNCAAALHKAQKELMSREITELDVDVEMTLLFTQYAGAIPQNFYHEVCALGD